MTTQQLELSVLTDIGLLVHTDLKLHCMEKVNFVLLAEQHGRMVFVGNTHHGEMFAAVESLLESVRRQPRCSTLP